MADYKVCPLCRVHVKVNDSGKFIQHDKYVPRAGIWLKGKTCKKSGKKAE